MPLSIDYRDESFPVDGNGVTCICCTCQATHPIPLGINISGFNKGPVPLEKINPSLDIIAYVDFSKTNNPHDYGGEWYHLHAHNDGSIHYAEGKQDVFPNDMITLWYELPSCPLD